MPVKNWRILLEGAKFYCPHTLANGNLCIQIKENMLEFSSTMLPASSPTTFTEISNTYLVAITVTRMYRKTQTGSELLTVTTFIIAGFLHDCL